jgi:hypothetical protein
MSSFTKELSQNPLGSTFDLAVDIETQNKVLSLSILSIFTVFSIIPIFTLSFNESLVHSVLLTSILSLSSLLMEIFILSVSIFLGKTIKNSESKEALLSAVSDTFVVETFSRYLNIVFGVVLALYLSLLNCMVVFC